MPEGLGFWLSFWAGFAVLDLIVDPSLSDTTARTFRVDTPAGRAALGGSLAGGAYILYRHVVNLRG